MITWTRQGLPKSLNAGHNALCLALTNALEHSTSYRVVKATKHSMSPLSWLWPAKVEEKKPSPTGWLERINYIQREHRTIVAFGSAVAITFIAFSLHGRFRKRCPNGGWVTPDMMGTGRRLKGVVTRCEALQTHI